MIAVNDQQLQDFQEGLDWQVACRLPDGRVLGKMRNPEQGIRPAAAPPIVMCLQDYVETAGKTIVELGCGEGQFTVHLAQICKQVVAVDVRPKNILCCLARLFVHDVHNVRCLLQDVRELHVPPREFDIIFHQGLLYHLENPVEHLHTIRDMADTILLNTHYCMDDTDFPRADITYGGKTYKAYRYREFGWADQWSGLDPFSRWLHRDTLLDLLRELGFDSVEVIDDNPLREIGPRMTVLARRAASLSELDESQAIRRRLRALEQELARARQEVCRHRADDIRRMRNSWTRRIGRLLTGPLRIVRRSWSAGRPG
jgi:SAM-dependent methyltransferase